MATAQQPVDDLLEAVKQLPADALAEFTNRLAEWQETAGDDGPSESFLVRQTKLRIPRAEARRLRELTGRSESGSLTVSELQEYRRLARTAERISATRVAALAELARRRNQPVERVKRDVGWPTFDHGA
ncbi:MAG: hypothetical protein KY476_07620 [Planctomycetes bacterium]|nr:hypothetical protein [Planctomycetota bacterium]